MQTLEAVRDGATSPAWLRTDWREIHAVPVTTGDGLLTDLSRSGEPALSAGTIEAFAEINGGARPADAFTAVGSLCDAAVATMSSGVWLMRGGASRVRLFVDRRQLGRIRLTDRIRPGEARLRTDFLVFAIAHSIHSPFERGATAETIFEGIECLPPASYSRIDSGGALSPVVLDHATAEFDALGRAATLEAVRAAVDQAIKDALDAAGDRIPVFEISGGIDSSLVAARALAYLRSKQDDAQRLAVTIHYPYHEFRREAEFASAVSDALELAVAPVTGENCLPSDGWLSATKVPCGDEPGLQQVGRAQHLATLSAGGAQARVLFHGFGGDTIFGFGPVQQFLVRKPPARPAWMSHATWRAFLIEWEKVRAHFPDTPEGHRRQFFSGANIDDCWADMYLAPRLGSVRAGGFTDPRLLGAVERLWKLGPEDGEGRYKWILRDAFRDSLPAIVREREHKIAYDGLYVRGFRRHRDALHSLVGRHSALLDDSGISASRVKVAIDRLALGNLDDDLLLSMLLCCLEWLEATVAVNR